MSYTALYRKWRPARFEDVKGQEPVVTTLQNQIKAERIGHAYLFCGTRGTGKTTVAKIFAKAVNCEQPQNGSPCGECASCRAVSAGNSMNVIEIDAASNNGVDSIREIREEVQYSPAQGRYKVYIIDEVHMLSIGAFNALLKTLEEPPSYVIFILATTEAHKIPVTILSRCQRYDFRRISIETIGERLAELTEAEGVEAEEKAIRYIAKAADGSMRDALSLLDQCIAFYLGKKLTYDNVLEVLGATDTEILGRLLRLVLEGDGTGVILLLEEMIMQGRELSQFVLDFTWYLRNLLLIQTADKVEEVIDVSSENLKLLKEEAKLADPDTLMRYIRVLSELSNTIKFSTQKRVQVEIALIKLTRPAMEQNYEDILSRLSLLERKMEQGIEIRQTAVGKAQQETPPAEESVPPVKEALPDELDDIAARWNSVVYDMEDELLKNLLMHQGRIFVSPDKTGIDIGGLTPLHYDYLNGHLAEIEEAVARKTGRHVKLSVIQAGQGEGREDIRNLYQEKIKHIEVVIDDDKEDLI